MVKHSLLIIYRNFKRFKVTFLINLAGLSTGLGCAVLIYLWVADELRMDKFHQHDTQLFQVMTNQNRPDDIVTLGHGPALLPDELAAEFPEIEYAAGSSDIGESFTLSVPGKNIPATGQFAGKHYFTMFSYPVSHGQAARVLDNKNGIVLSESLAVSLFGSPHQALGKSLEWEIRGYKFPALVTGVFANIRSNSSHQFDFVMPFEVYKDLIGSSVSWGNHNALTYLQLRKDVVIPDFNAKIENFIKTRDPKSNLTIFVRPFSDDYLYGKYENGKLVGGRITYVKLFSVIAVFILVIACINFMNLATARASTRIKEVGIKKAIGAARRTLVMQYLGESLLMSFLSLAIAVLLVDLFLPQFNTITGKSLDITGDGDLFGVLACIAIVTGLLAGSYPALYLSGFNPAAVIKGRLHSSGGEQWARKGLVVFQFMLSVIFIVSVWVIYQQMQFVQRKHLGFERDNIVFFKAEGLIQTKFETFIQELKSLPGVANASGMWGSVMGMTSFTTGDFRWKGRDPEQIIQFEHLGIQYDMIELLGATIVQGRSFSRAFPADTTSIILNETAVEVTGLEDPVGETFGLWGRDYKIIGVVKDFHFHSLHHDVKPFFFRITPDEIERVMVKLKPGEEAETLARIEGFFKKFNPGYVFDFEFLDAEFHAQYKAEQRVATLSRYFAGLAILISCLGLFGLAAFTSERRLKEIGIRKVLGSSVTGIVYLLSSDFNRVVFTAIVLALPVSYFGIKVWLDNFAYRIDLAWWYFAGAGAVALGIAWLTVGFQAWKAARVNPVKCLKDE